MAVKKEHSAKTRSYGSKSNDKVKSKTGNEFNEGQSKFNVLMKKRMEKGRKP